MGSNSVQMKFHLTGQQKIQLGPVRLLKELESAKKERINGWQNAIYNLEYFSSFIQKYYNNGYSLNDFSGLGNRINSITLEGINSAAEKMFDPNNFMMVVVGNKDSCAAFLEQFKNYEYYEQTDELR